MVIDGFWLVLGFNFQENLLKTMMQLEETYFTLGHTCPRNVLIICDRGTLDASACECQFLSINVYAVRSDTYSGFYESPQWLHEHLPHLTV